MDAADEGDGGGGGSDRYIMLWTKVMPDGETTVETPEAVVELPADPLLLLRREVIGARGAKAGGAISFLV